MTITIKSTEQMVTINNDIQARVWEGTTESGIKVQCLIARIAVGKSENQEQFQRELQEAHCPEPASPAFSLRMVL